MTIHTATQTETPENYIRFAVQRPRDIIAGQYREKLLAFLLNNSENAGEIFSRFLAAANSNANLRSTFYTSVHFAFEQIRRMANGYPLRWNGLMEQIATTSTDDATLQKYLRETLLAKTIPALLGSQSGFNEFQIASDILTVAGRHKHLADSVTPQSVSAVTAWHFSTAQHSFLLASSRFSMLRESSPFIPAVTKLENKHGIHVDSSPLDHDPRKTLVIEFNRANGSAAIWVIDLSKAGRSAHPRSIEMNGTTTQYHAQISEILLRSTDLPDQNWVEPIATDLYYQLG